MLLPADTLLPRAEDVLALLAELPLPAELPLFNAGIEAVVPPTAAPPRIGEPVAASRPVLLFKSAPMGAGLPFEVPIPERTGRPPALAPIAPPLPYQ
jgi:hypothetical protein